MQLNRVMIFVKDMPRMSAFYQNVLGFGIVKESEMEDYVELCVGAVTLALHAIPQALAEEIEITAPPQPREQNPVKLIFEVENMDMERKRLENLGVILIERSWGALDGVDLEGNVFGIYKSA